MTEENENNNMSEEQAATAQPTKKRMTKAQKQATLQTCVWITLSLLVVGLFGWFIAIPSISGSIYREAQMPQVTSTTTQPVVVEPEQAAKLVADLDLRPKYGGIEKTPEQAATDEKFVAGVLSLASTTEEALQTAVHLGWGYFDTRDTDMAMRRFNQAWLIDPESADALWGMAVVEGARGNFDSSLELFGEALTYDDTNPGIYCDLGNTFFTLATAEEVAREGMLLLAQEQYIIADDLYHEEAACYANFSAVTLLLGDEEQATLYEDIAQELAGTSSTETTE